MSNIMSAYISAEPPSVRFTQRTRANEFLYCFVSRLLLLNLIFHLFSYLCAHTYALARTCTHIEININVFYGN